MTGMVAGDGRRPSFDLTGRVAGSKAPQKGSWALDMVALAHTRRTSPSVYGRFAGADDLVGRSKPEPALSSQAMDVLELDQVGTAVAKTASELRPGHGQQRAGGDARDMALDVTMEGRLRPPST